MARKSTTVTTPRSRQYRFKQLLIRSGYAHLPSPIIEEARAQVQEQVDNWNRAFGKFHDVWVRAKSSVLDPAVSQGTISKLDYVKYKAFIGQYVSKVIIKGTETAEAVKEKYVRLGADRNLLDQITNIVGEVLS